jgi:hypothetical protein
MEPRSQKEQEAKEELIRQIVNGVFFGVILLCLVSWGLPRVFTHKTEEEKFFEQYGATRDEEQSAVVARAKADMEATQFKHDTDIMWREIVERTEQEINK